MLNTATLELRNVDPGRLVFRSIDLTEIAKDERGVPTEFRIFAYGEIYTEKGVDVFDDTSIYLLKEQIEQMGRSYPFDYDHLSLNPKSSAEDRRAAGFHELEIRGKELWAVNCTWTNEAVRRIGKEAGEEPEFKYFSPAFYKDEDGRIVRYINCAVTNNPATWGVAALRSTTAEEGKNKMLEQLMKMLGLRAEDIEGKSEEEVTEAFNNAIKARAAGEPGESGEPTENSEGGEDPPPSDAVPATKSAEEEAARSLVKPAAKPAAKPAMKGLDLRDIEKLLTSYGLKKAEPAKRNTVPTGGAGGKHMIGDWTPITNPQFRALAGLPLEEDKIPKKAPDGMVFDEVNSQFVILRNTGDMRRYQEMKRRVDHLRMV